MGFGINSNNNKGSSSSSSNNNDDENESLLTAKALQLSLTPPRCPPYYTAQRSLMMGWFPTVDRPYVTAHDGVREPSSTARTGIASWTQQSLIDRFLFTQHQPPHDGTNGNRQVLDRRPWHPFHPSLQSSHGLPRRHAHHRPNIPPPIAVHRHHHPHLPSLGPPDLSTQMTRLLGTVLPMSWQHSCRDSGGFRSICDRLVTATIPLAAISHPTAAVNFARLTYGCGTVVVPSDGKCDSYVDELGEKEQEQEPHGPPPAGPRRRRKIERRRIVYGTVDRKVQFIDVYIPKGHPDDGRRHHHPPASSDDDDSGVRGMVIFVHGGAWGSGKPWFYRLVALPFVRRNLAVAIVGYRVYPEGDVNVQVNDLDAAFVRLCMDFPDWCGPDRHRRRRRRRGSQLPPATNSPAIGTIIVGHSSGAHIALLWIVERVKRAILERDALRTQQSSSPHSFDMRFVDAFVGIAGPYNIDHHFDYEAARGVEEISPMKAANGFTRDAFVRNSPAWRLRDFLSQLHESDPRLALGDYFPRTLLVHGIEDETVPFTATGEAAQMLRSCGLTECDEFYVPNTDHQEAVVHLMLGGRTEDVIVKWLDGLPGERASTELRSKL